MIPSQFDPAALPVRSTFADDEDFVELLRAFADTIPEKQQTVLELRRAGSFDELRRWAHQLKGAAGGYGFPELTEVAAELEQACKAQDADRITLGVDSVLDYLKRIAV
ncbi:MAG TPA: Hpt domain-containing protein [Planctomycetaceae bacterium]|nr:Hpt domain-containing protein [Planctomycetaceae bacterium]